MHVLIIPSWYVSPQRPDLGIYFREHALALWQAGQETGVVYVDFGLNNAWNKLLDIGRPGSAFYIDEGLPTLRMDVLGLPKRFSWSIELYAKLVCKGYKEYCQKVGVPDIIHAQGYTAGFAASRIKQQWNIPFVYTEHMSTLKNHQYPPAHGKMLRASLQAADAITTVSSALASWLQEKTVRTIQVIPNLVNIDYFKPDPAKKTSTFRFLYVGDLIPIKAPDVLLRAFAIFRPGNTEKNVRLEVVGTGHLRTTLEKLSHDLAISEYVHFHGLLPAAAVVTKMQEANCLVLTSQTETFGVVQIEAMACGLPVIATDCGGPADIVTQETGILVPIGHITALANAMTTMVQQSIYYDPIKIRASAVKRFGSEHVSQRWIDLYNEVVKI